MIGGTMSVNGSQPVPEGTAMHLLACGIPLSLIMDLAAPGGPASQEILTAEGCPEDNWWER
jgi:hypothetical protein